MAKVRLYNPNDTRPSEWHTKVWNFIESHSGVAERYEATRRPDGTLDYTQLSPYDQAVIREAERLASG